MTTAEREQLLREFAERHGRTLEEERALAEEAWCHSALLASLLDPATQEHLGDLVPAYREHAVMELRALYGRAFPDREFEVVLH